VIAEVKKELEAAKQASRVTESPIDHIPSHSSSTPTASIPDPSISTPLKRKRGKEINGATKSAEVVHSSSSPSSPLHTTSIDQMTPPKPMPPITKRVRSNDSPQPSELSPSQALATRDVQSTGTVCNAKSILPALAPGSASDTIDLTEMDSDDSSDVVELDEVHSDNVNFVPLVVLENDPEVVSDGHSNKYFSLLGQKSSNLLFFFFKQKKILGDNSRWGVDRNLAH
jgi:hypothetical protein